MPESLDVVILAAGKGKRMNSGVPKVLHRVCGITLLERAAAAAAALRPGRIIVVAGFEAEAVEKETKRLSARPCAAGIEFRVALQEEQKGTGHAVQTALPLLREQAARVLIIPGDTPLITAETVKPLLEAASSDPADLVVLTCRHPEPAQFGRIVRDSSGSISRIVEYKDCTPEQRAIEEINTSIYLCTPSFLRQALPALRSDNAQGEYYLTDIVGYGTAHGLRVTAAAAADYELTLGANSRAELSALEQRMRQKLNNRLMEEGVTMEDPGSAYIEESVKIGRDTFVGAGTRLCGSTEIASGVVIEGSTLIRDSAVGQGTVIKLFSYIEQAEIGENCQIGPFAHLRPGSKLHENVKVGNFVETKKTELHAGAKASHLTYLGDAEIGAGTNVGAGTITCNYDGTNKFKTRVGSGCFIGSNTALVAPVVVGDGAFIGAGSTITEDVPAQALGVARGRQHNVEGWALRKKEQS